MHLVVNVNCIIAHEYIPVFRLHTNSCPTAKNQPQNRLHKNRTNAQNFKIPTKFKLKHGGFVGCIFLLGEWVL
jgi:hypothetical protein